jgi:hypothetical protein
MKIIVAVVCFSLLIPLATSVSFQDPDPGTQKQSTQDPIPVPDEGSVERRDFMRTKLMYTQNILEGMTVSEFELIERGVKELEQILEAEQWVTIDNAEYRKLVDDFKTALQRVKKASESKNIEATALRFYEMSTRCIDCHQHLEHADYHY